MIRLGISLGAILFVGAAVAEPASPALSTEFAQNFARNFLGLWDGEALETPVGPMNYDIGFQRCGESIAGVAETGASLHYWRLWSRDGMLRLRFLSTFGGNRQSTLLIPRDIEADSVEFFAPDLNLLTLKMTTSEGRVDIRVFHHGKPHVHIRLLREAEGITDQPGTGGFCAGLPPSLLEP